MKCIITILQNKRVALPYIFGKYCFPKMSALFNGTMDLYHVVHTNDLQNFPLASNSESTKDKQKLVHQATKDDWYENANIVKHNTTKVIWPIIPSAQLAIKLATDANADFHLWMEDDAIIYDLLCGKWATLMGSADVGLYKNTAAKQMINVAYFLSTPEFDQRISRILDEYVVEPYLKYADKGSQYENAFWLAARECVVLNNDAVTRQHPYACHNCTGTQVANWLKKKIPEITQTDLDLLKLDFTD